MSLLTPLAALLDHIAVVVVRVVQGLGAVGLLPSSST